MRLAGTGCGSFRKYVGSYILLYSTLLYSTPFYSILLCSVAFFTPFHSILLCSVLFIILFASLLFCFHSPILCFARTFRQRPLTFNVLEDELRSFSGPGKLRTPESLESPGLGFTLNPKPQNPKP